MVKDFNEPQLVNYNPYFARILFFALVNKCVMSFNETLLGAISTLVECELEATQPDSINITIPENVYAKAQAQAVSYLDHEPGQPLSFRYLDETTVNVSY